MDILLHLFSSACASWVHILFGGARTPKGPDGSIVCAKTSLNFLRHSNPEILHFEAKKKAPFSSPPPVLLRRVGEMEEFFSLQNAKSRDWSVVGSSNLFWHTIWTHPALLGCAPRRKVCAPMRHTRLKKNGAKCPFFGQNGYGCAWCPQIMWGAPAPPECVKQGLESKRMVYTPS